MSILNHFERHQISRTLIVDYNGSNYPNTFNYLNDLIFFKHQCNCNNCKTLTRNLTTRIIILAADINFTKTQSNAIPLEINQEISYILAQFEGYHALDIPNVQY